MTNIRLISWAMIAVVVHALSHSPPANAQSTGVITDLPTITVGVGADGKAAGYCTSAASNCGAGSGTNYGSISTTTTLDGFTFVALADLPGPPRVGDTYFRSTFQVAGFAASPGQNWFTSIVCNDRTYLSSLSQYNFANGVATWYFNRSVHGALPAFQGQTRVTCRINRPGDSGWVRPKYQVVGLTYAPPGSRSNASYNSGFESGTNTSHASSFTAGITQRVSITTGGGLFGILDGEVTQTFSAGWSQQEEDSRSLSIKQQNSSGLIVPGPASSAAGVDHDYDTIHVWLNPEIFMMVFPTTVVMGGYGYDARDTVTGMDVVPLTVGQLRGTQPINASLQARLNRSWDPQLGGLTTADYQVILRANPFAINPGYNPNTDPTRRYELPLSGSPPLPSNLIINYTPAPPGGQPIGQTYSSSYSSTSTAGQSARDTYTVSYSVDGSASFDFIVKLSSKLNTTTTFTYSNQWSRSVTSGTSQSASFTIFPPFASDNYNGPTAMQVWKDNVYGTFMFYPQN